MIRRVDERDMAPYYHVPAKIMKVRNVTRGHLYRFYDYDTYRHFWRLTAWPGLPPRTAAARWKTIRRIFGGDWGKKW